MTSVRAWVCTVSMAALALPMAGQSAGMAVVPAAQSSAGDAGQLPKPDAAHQRPNVLVWMMDDVGYAQVGSFGGLVDTPNIDRIAARGLRYSNYHTSPVCSPSRASFLTGRNPHTVHVGAHSAGSRPFPGYDVQIPASAGTIAENLRQSGYITFALGKWDHSPPHDLTSAGPFTRWPERQGFDRFYGFLTADTDNWSPTLWNGLAPVENPSDPNYHLNKDMADRAIEFINGRSAQSAMPPFFMYWATSTAHAPHHAPADWVARYKGKFDAGWDVLRQQAFNRMMRNGAIPTDAKLPPRPDDMPAWKELSPDSRRLFARQMEVFAASLSYADAQFGRILDDLEARGELENTIVVVTSDNGSSAEGGERGTYNEATFSNAYYPSVEQNMEWLDTWGGPETFPHYAYGWAITGNTPFRYHKQTTFEGGTHVPFVISWPKGIKASGEWRRQFTYVADITPTILEAVNVPAAKIVNDAEQSPFDGVSFGYSFADPAKVNPRTQYIESHGHRAVFQDGWKVVSLAKGKPWDLTVAPNPNAPWQLYNLTKDPTELNDLAESMPQKVSQLDAVFKAEGQKFNVFPMVGNVSPAQVMAALAAQESGGHWSYPGPVSRIDLHSAPPFLRRSYSMSADVNLASGSETGPIFAAGGRLLGLGLYLQDGKPVFAVQDIAGRRHVVTADQSLLRGQNRLSLSVVQRPGGPVGPTSMEVTITVNGRKAASGSIAPVMPRLQLSSTETFDIGRDYGSPITSDYPKGAAFPGKLSNIVFETPK